MAPPLDQSFPSTPYQESHLNQERPVSNHNNLNSLKMEYGLNNHFINESQACMDHSALDFNNFVPTSFVDDNHLSVGQSSLQCEISDTTQRDELQQQFNQKNHSQYAHIHQNIGEELLCPKPQIDVPGDFTLFPISQDLESYESSPFVNDIQKIQPINLSQVDLMCSQSQSAINPSGILQLDPSSTAPPNPSPGFGHIHFESSLNTSNSSMGPLIQGLFHTGSQDWNLCQPQFLGHRRTPSEYSEVSATSAQHSPNIIHQLNFDQQNSPMQNAQDSNLYQEVLTFGEISISDPQVQQGQSTRSSAHSPAISPRLDAHEVVPDDSILGALDDRLCHSQQVFPHEPFPLLNSDTGQAKQMIPPEINVEFAPITHQNTFQSQTVAKFDKDALTPPEKGRRRAFTDTTSVNPSSHFRSHGSWCILPQQNPNLSECSYQQHRSLSPHHGARVSSPIRLRRLSTPSIPNRDHNISLVNSEYQNTVLDNGISKRGQRHPATFLCTLCPKKFTRAYNLRSHLRTHTDERPFTCRVCSKAFARQHDRKRHEELHSGKKKFICKGELKQGGQWGCGRRFARADALGRHFRSEAGRGCINLLLDEEARERQRVWDEKQMQDMQQAQSQSLLSLDVDNLSSHFMLPAALLAQYPALATVSWSELPQNDTGIEDDPSGRSSFEASGSEYYDDVDERIYN